MRDLPSFFVNPFDDKEISLNELLAFSTDHLGRMTANNASGALSERITATTEALSRLLERVTEDLGQLGVRKARKQAKSKFRKALPAAVTKLVATVVAQYGDDTPQISECVPNGRSIFSTCRDDQVGAHLQTLITALTAHEADLGAQVVTKATELKTTWEGIYNESEAATATKARAEALKKEAREGLQLMLFLNLVKLTSLFPRQPEKVSLYMQQHLLENPASANEEEGDD